MVKQKVVVLGAGRVGKAIAADLSNDFDVTSADISQDALQSLSSRYPLSTRVMDLGNAAEVGDAVRDADLVVSAVPGHMGFNTLKTIIEKRKDVVDISFFAEDAFDLGALFYFKYFEWARGVANDWFHAGFTPTNIIEIGVQFSAPSADIYRPPVRFSVTPFPGRRAGTT